MKTKLYLVVLGASCLARVASGQFAIEWCSIDSGGGTSSGGDFTLSASVGEVSAGSTSGGDFSFDGGFWSLDTTLVTLPPPVLQVAPGPNNTIVVSWPSPSAGWSLQRTPDLNVSVWTDVTDIPADDGVTKSLSFDASAGSLYLRLKQ